MSLLSEINQQGFAIERGLFSETEIQRYREECERLAAEKPTACLRHLREQSGIFADLPLISQLQKTLPKGYIPVRSILFDKTEKENWLVAWHQDLTITVKEKVETGGYGPWSTKGGAPHVQPPHELLSSMVTARIHLDHTGIDNGALYVIPKSHLQGKMSSEDVINFPKEHHSLCECLPGDVLWMKPLTIHSSQKSTKPKKRRVLHFEYAPLETLDPSLAWLEHH